MSLGLEQLKRQYNKTLVREKKAEEFLNKATEEECRKWVPEFLKIIVQLSKMIKEYKKLTGKEMTEEDVREGFRG